MPDGRQLIVERSRGIRIDDEVGISKKALDTVIRRNPGHGSL
jgi:hypothetical protein